MIDKIVSHSGAEQFPFFKPVWSAKTNGNGLTVVIDVFADPRELPSVAATRRRRLISGLFEPVAEMNLGALSQICAEPAGAAHTVRFPSARPAHTSGDHARRAGVTSAGSTMPSG